MLSHKYAHNSRFRRGVNWTLDVKFWLFLAILMQRSD
jgi:hypothetical protein